jgi:ribonuclease HI
MKQASLLPSQPSSNEWIAYIDGGSRGNPGPAGYGVVIQDAAGHEIDTLAESIGRATNNRAEYEALLAALRYAIEHGGGRIEVNCDSELIVRQMQGRYRVKSPELIPLHQRAREFAGRFERFAIRHIPRERNAQADQLANDAMDRAQGISRRERTEPASTPALAQSLTAVWEGGVLRPVGPAPPLDEGAEYEIRLRKRN